MKIAENLTRWIWVVIPVCIMLLFEKMIFAALQIIYGNLSNINPEIFFYLPFLSLLPPSVLFLLWYWQKNKHPEYRLSIIVKKKYLPDIYIGVGVAIVNLIVFISSFAVLRYFSVTLPDFSSLSLTHHIFFSTLGAIVPGIAEEIYFRGFLSKKLSNLKPSLIILITALSFAFWHIMSPPYLLHTFLIGVILGVTFYFTKRMLPVIIGHSLANMTAGVLILNGFV